MLCRPLLSSLEMEWAPGKVKFPGCLYALAASSPALLSSACCLAAGLPRQEATLPPLLVSREQGHTQSPVCLLLLLGPVAFVTGATCGCARF